jgi:hypothetical protein
MKKTVARQQSAITTHNQQMIWLTIAYAVVMALVLYPGLHEGFAGRIIFWNCLPPTLAFILLITSRGKSIRRIVASALFAVISVTVGLFFVVAWFFTPLDTDPHSSATTLVFIYAPLFSLAAATAMATVTWLAMRLWVR